MSKLIITEPESNSTRLVVKRWMSTLLISSSLTFLPPTDKTNTLEGLWETLCRSSTFTEGPLNTPPLTSRPYLTYVRRYNGADLIFAPRVDLQSVSRFGDQNPQWIEKRTPISQPDFRFLEELVIISNETGRRPMLREVSIDRWEDRGPLILSCHALERLSMHYAGDLTAEAGRQVSKSLPRLRHLEFPFVANATAASEKLGEFLSHLNADQLHHFECGVGEAQASVFRAIAKQTELRCLEFRLVEKPPLDLLLLSPLTNLTSLTLKSNSFVPSWRLREKYELWAREKHRHIANWITSCRSLKRLHLFRLPDLIPAIADALPHLQLERLHVYDTGNHPEFYHALKTQSDLKHLFIAERSTDPPPRDLRCRKLVMDAVCSMKDLRDLRLHTSFSLYHIQLQTLACCQPNLEFLSFVQSGVEQPAWVLRALELFENLKSLTILGMTRFSAPEILEWIEKTGCHRRHGGFLLSLPSQEKASWYRGVPLAELPPMRTVGRDSFTRRIKELLRFCAVKVRGPAGTGESWHGNDYLDYEESMFHNLWGDARGPTAVSIWRERVQADPETSLHIA